MPLRRRILPLVGASFASNPCNFNKLAAGRFGRFWPVFEPVSGAKSGNPPKFRDLGRCRVSRRILPLFRASFRKSGAAQVAEFPRLSRQNRASR